MHRVNRNELQRAHGYPVVRRCPRSTEGCVCGELGCAFRARNRHESNSHRGRQLVQSHYLAEGHDEVGNENGRIGNVGGFGRGLRRAKVAACVTMFSRGVPTCFMGGEAGEHRQFTQGSDDALDLAVATRAATGRVSWHGRTFCWTCVGSRGRTGLFHRRKFRWLVRLQKPFCVEPAALHVLRIVEFDLAGVSGRVGGRTYERRT
jgi:hypothetical protein